MGTASTPSGGGESVVVHALVRCEARAVDGTRQVLYEAYPPSAPVVDEGPFERAVVGFAELPADAHVPPCADREAFDRRLDRIATYVHWKGGGER